VKEPDLLMVGKSWISKKGKQENRSCFLTVCKGWNSKEGNKKIGKSSLLEGSDWTIKKEKQDKGQLCLTQLNYLIIITIGFLLC